MLQFSEHLIVQLIALRVLLSLKSSFLYDLPHTPAFLCPVPLLACLLNQAVYHFLDPLSACQVYSYLKHRLLILFLAPNHRDDLIFKHFHAICAHTLQAGKDHQQLLVLFSLNARE